MKRYVRCSKCDPKSYEFHGFRIYDNGYGFTVYKGSKTLGNQFSTSKEAEDFVINHIKANN